VAFSAAAFFSSSTASGRPFTTSTTSSRRVCLFSTTLNWFTASQSLPAGSSKSIARACAPRMLPAASRYSTVTPSTSRRCSARLRTMRSAPSGRVSLRKASSKVSAGSEGLSRASASRRRCASTTCP
jgi:hypothetical protein